MRSPKEICREIYEVGFSRDVDALDRLIAPDGFITHGNPGPTSGGQTAATAEGERVSVEELKETFRMFQTGLEDFRIEVQHLVAEGDLVAIHAEMLGRHVRPFMALPATDNAVRLMFLDLMRIADGRAVEHWGLFDRASLRFQLGERPPVKSG